MEGLNRAWADVYQSHVQGDSSDLVSFYAFHAVQAFRPRPTQEYLIDLFSAIANSTGSAMPAERRDDEKEWQCWLVREVFGNPFRPVDFAPWQTDTAVALARQMYDQNDFSAMPILADALQDAGCDNLNVLDHCRDPGEHVCGCWVIDTLLGKG